MANTKKPNILVIWGDDIGIANLSCYTHGLMGYRTPNIDRVANLAATGVPIEFVFPKEGVWGWKEVAVVVKGRPNQDLAYKFINQMMSKMAVSVHAVMGTSVMTGCSG